MTIITCIECGRVSPDKNMDDLAEMGWNRAKGKINGKHYDVSMCPSSGVDHFIEVLIRTLNFLKKH